VFLVLHFRLLGHIGIGSPYSEGIIKSRDTTGISDREYREYHDITQERIVYHDILKNVDRPMSSVNLFNCTLGMLLLTKLH